jgi:hypothetical protein
MLFHFLRGKKVWARMLLQYRMPVIGSGLIATPGGTVVRVDINPLGSIFQGENHCTSGQSIL